MLNTQIKKYLLALSIFTLSTSAFSNELSYNYVEGIYSSITNSVFDNDLDADGYAAVGSVSISENIAVTALIGATSFDEIAGIDIDSTEYNIGITAHTPIAPETDVFGNFSIINGEVEVSDGINTVSDDDTGNVITLGLRHMASERVEIAASFARIDIFDDTGNSFGIGARYFADDKLSIGVGYSTGDDVEAISLSARINFK